MPVVAQPFWSQECHTPRAFPLPGTRRIFAIPGYQLPDGFPPDSQPPDPARSAIRPSLVRLEPFRFASSSPVVVCVSTRGVGCYPTPVAYHRLALGHCPVPDFQFNSWVFRPRRLQDCGCINVLVRGGALHGELPLSPSCDGLSHGCHATQVVCGK